MIVIIMHARQAEIYVYGGVLPRLSEHFRKLGSSNASLEAAAIGFGVKVSSQLLLLIHCWHIKLSAQATIGGKPHMKIPEISGIQTYPDLDAAH